MRITIITALISFCILVTVAEPNPQADSLGKDEEPKSYKDIDGKKCNPQLIGRKVKKFPSENKTCQCNHEGFFVWKWRCYDDEEGNRSSTQKSSSTSSGSTSSDSIPTSTSTPPSIEWEMFKVKHNKRYRSKEHHDRAQKAYHENVKRVEAHNKEYERGHAKHKLAINKYADMDQKTFHATHHGIDKTRVRDTRSLLSSTRFVRQGNTPASFDWRDTNKVSAVRDQDPCGDCWTFATMGSIESQMLIANRTTPLLSEQQLVDCDNNQGNGGGCNGGGWPDRALNYLKSVGGAMTDASYPYSSGDFYSPNYGKTGTCQFNGNSTVVNITGMNQVSMPTTNETLMNAVYTNGPHTLVVDASQWDSQHSRGYLPCPATPEVEHAVLLVGYGVDSNGTAYWIIKNQWGTGWGLNGFGQIAMGQDCGATQFQALAPIIQ